MVGKVKKRSFRYRDEKSAYFMIMPAVLVIVIFQVVPLVMAILRAFQDYNTGEFVGFRNFVYVLRQEVFVKSFTNILIFLVFIMVIMVVITFLFAQVLKRMKNKFGSATKIIIYLPTLFSGILVSIMFLFIFNYGGGLITSILLGLDKDAMAVYTDYRYFHMGRFRLSLSGNVRRRDRYTGKLLRSGYA